jgi:Amino acid permease
VSDSAAHMAEETKTAGRSVPMAMVWSYVLNGAVGFIMLITLLFSLPDIGAALDLETNPSGFVFLYIFQNASYHGSIPLVVMVLLVTLTGVTDSACSTSRQIFAFARDGGLPFKRFLVKVRCSRAVLLAILIRATGRKPRSPTKCRYCDVYHHCIAVTHQSRFINCFQCHNLSSATSSYDDLLYQHRLCAISTNHWWNPLTPETI